MVVKDSESFISDMYKMHVYGEDYAVLNISEEQLSELIIYDCTIKFSVFSNCDFNGTSFENSELTTVEFRRCDLSNVCFSGINLTRIKFIECKLEEADFSSAVLENCTFSGCDGLVIMEGAKLNNCTMVNCDFEDSNFIEAEMTSSKLGCNSFNGVNFDYASVVEVDFTGSTLINAELDFSVIHLLTFNGINVPYGYWHKNPSRTDKNISTKTIEKTYTVCKNAVLIQG